MSHTKKEYERIRGLISQWNDDHYDIFELSLPNEDLEFHGVVRFFFQGAAGANVVTKCIRVASSATTREVIDVLIEKFRPDMRMLGQNKYALYEVHVNGEERRLRDDERPLYVQVEWGIDVREGRFLLRNEDDPTVRDPALGFDKSVLERDQAGFKRKLSKREKKEKKRRERDKGKENVNGGDDDGVAGKLYSEAPETSFTRTISNPEAVMRRRRQQKLEKKLAEMNAAEGGNDSGGTLKIFGESLCPGVPYKTLFLSTADPTTAVIKEAMEKYGLDKEDPFAYCLVEVLLPPGGMEYHGGQTGDERVLDDSECPLAIVMQHAKHSRNQGHIIFQLRQRSSEMKKRGKRPRAVSHEDLRNHQSDQRHTNVEMLPYLLEISVRGKPKQHVLPLNVTEVVNVTEVANNRSDYNGKHFLQLSGPDIKPRHCVIAHTEGIVTMTPNNQDAETYVERQRIYETTMLKHGMTVQFGKDKVYRFLDPRFDGVNRPQSQRAPPQETTFDVDGKVDSSPTQAAPGWEAQQRRSGSDRSPGSYAGSQGMEDLLPASVEFLPDGEDRLLQASILEVNSKQLQFKLAPTYTLYMAARNLLAARSPPAHKAQMIADFVSKTSKMTQQCIQEHHNDPPSLAFWMANSSEILHMFKQDRDVQPLSSDCQEMLAEAVQMAFHHLVRCLQGDLQRVMPAFLDPAEDERDEEMGQRYNMGRPTLADVLNTLSAAMTLLRRCRVNAALTIQLFSQLFHFINMWLFNILVTEPQLQLCTRLWGLRLKKRLGSVEAWAEKQGLELAADCHLCRIIQAAHLLQAPKSSADDITNISSTCFKLNSMQLRALLTRYIPEPNEPPVSGAFIERVVAIAENMADELTKTDGREVRLEEDPDLHLPFLLPEDGYSCDTIKGVPNGLPEFVRQLESAGLCRFAINNNASGVWTVYMGDGPPPERGNQSPGMTPSQPPEIITVSFNKVKGSMGLSIVAAMGEGQHEQGIYIKSVVDGGAAALDGRLQAGDQLLEVDGKSLVGLSQDKAAELMTKTGQVVRLRVAKQGAFYHNLATLLSQPSPTSQRAAHNRGGQRTNEEGPPPPYDGRNGGYGPEQKEPYHRRDIDPKSKSTSNLHVETTFDRTDMAPPNSNQMKPAQSVGVLHPASPGYNNQYSPGGRRQEPQQRYSHNDYENQPNYPEENGGPRQRGSYEGNNRMPPQQQQQLQQQGYNFVDPRQNPTKSNNQGPPPQGGYLQPGVPQRASDRSSVSSRASSNNSRDTRPQSAYYDPHGNQPHGGVGNNPEGNVRPRSEDMSRVKADWQDPNNRGSFRRNDSSGRQSPPYSNMNAQQNQQPPMHQQQQQQQNFPPYQNNNKPSAHERLFNNNAANHSGNNPQRINVQAYNRQPNFYENTTPLQQERPPAFHQLHRPPSESEIRPKIMPKPAVMPKRNQHPVQHADIPMMKVDNRNTQPHFYGQQDQRGPAQPVSPQQHPGYNQAPPPQQPPDTRHQQPTLRNGPDLRSMTDPRNGPASPDYTNIGEHRNGYDPLLQKSAPPPDSRSVSDMRHMPDPRNGPDLRTMPDPRNGPDLRTMPDPRNGPNYPDTQYPPHTNDPANVNTQGYWEDLPPPPTNDYPPDLPPPPQMDDNPEELPPLPPPPGQDTMLAHKLAEEQQKLMQQINMTNQYLSTGRNKNNSPNSLGGQQPPPAQQKQQLHPQQQQQQPPRSNRPPPPQQQHPHHHQHHQQQQQQVPNNLHPSSRALPGMDNRDAPMGYQMVQDDYRDSSDNQHNYQNIGFAQDVRASSGPESQVPPPIPQPPSDYESYDNPSLQMQGFEVRPGGPSLPGKSRGPKPPDTVAKNAWDRDARERAEEEEQEELFKAREREINEMEARPYLNPQEQDRLRKLKMEHEFQRRAREVAEKGDYDVDDDEELAERIFTRGRLIQNLKDDMERTRKRFQDFEIKQQKDDMAREQERLQMMERRLEMYEKDREDQKDRMNKKQEKRAMQHQESLRQQRETREKQRQNYEEQKRQLLREEEKMNQRREEELNKKRQFERERRQELQEKRDAEEMRIRAEIRQEENDYAQQQIAYEKQQRLKEQRPIRVGEERKRLDSAAQYANVSGNSQVPPPPERNSSSFETYNQHQKALGGVGGPQRPGSLGQDFPSPTSNQDRYQLPSAMKNSQQEPLPPPKKSVSFNTQMNTYKDRTPSHSISSYKSPTESQSSDLGMPPPPMNFSPTETGDVFDPAANNEPPLPPPPPLMNNNNTVSSPTSPGNHRDIVYNTSNNTPNVIGAQEVYRDPRSKIEAKIASGRSQQASDRMSFREKMKYFATEAGEDTIKAKPKSSKTLRDIESQLHGGTG